MAQGPQIIQGIGLPPQEGEAVEEAQAPMSQGGSYKAPTIAWLIIALAILFGLLAIGLNFGVNVRVGGAGA